jgi:energy-coupling factor transporter ATP-binding protein EcfA2
MEPKKPFLEKLLKKLKTGDSRGIHLNALPGNFARLDIYDLVNIELSLHLKFLAELLNKPTFSFSITIDPKLTKGKSKVEADLINKIIKRLNFMCFQEQDLFQEEGTKTFAFGYPLLIKRDPINPKKIIKAPIAIWYLEIVKDTNRNNTWKISRNDDHPVILNEALETHLETTERINLDDLQPFFEDGLIDEKELVKLTNAFLAKLGITENIGEDLKIIPCPNKESIEKLTVDAPWIRWSGVFGLYKAQKQPIIKDLESLLADDYIKKTADFVSFQNETLTPIPLDPSQEKVVFTLEKKQKIIIQGPPGTGKSQTLTAIITNALLNGSTCLVVGEKKTAMEVIYNHLRKVGLGDLCILIEDINSNRRPIVERIRNLVETENPIPAPFRKNEYEALKLKYQKLREKANHALNAVENVFFGDSNWLELVALVTGKLGQINLNEVNFKLNENTLNFNYEEFILFKSVLEDGEQLYKKYNIENSIFRKIPSKKFERNLNSKIVFESINHIFNKSKALTQKIEIGIKDFGADFDNLKGFSKAKDAIFGLFSGRQKGINQLKSSCLAEYEHLKLLIEGDGFENYSLPNVLNLVKLSDVMNGLNAIQQSLNPIISDEENFDLFYNYAVFIEDQHPFIQLICKSYFEKENPISWIPYFEKWYINEVLKKYSKSIYLDENTQNLLVELVETEKDLFPLIAKKIIYDWEVKRQTLFASKDLSKIKQLYNYRKNKQFESRNSLRKIIFSDFDLFVNTFPVVMVSPVVASSILPLKEDLFDLVLMDEASQLRIEDTYSSLLRGRTKIISGDKHQMPPSSYFATTPVFLTKDEDEEADLAEADFLADSESLLEFASDSDFSLTYLDFHYRSQHPDLINFSNAAFYNSRLVPMPEKEDYVAIQLQQINGVYNKNGINESEAAAILNYLFEEIEMEDNVFPSIGVATLNLHQRNYIWELLMEKSYQSAEYAKKFENLMAAGLFVKNLENIQGDERDYIILSTTFGPDAEGKFRAQIGPLAQSKGYQLLNVIITRAKKAIQIYTSIPEQVYTNFYDEIKEKGNNGKGIFFAYLAYAKSISEGNLVQRNGLVSILKEQPGLQEKIKVNELLSNALKEDISTKLKLSFPEFDIVTNYTFGGIMLDIVFLKEAKPIFVVELEGKNAVFENAAYRNAMFKTQLLENYNLASYTIWSYNWWKDEANIVSEIKLKLTGLE